MLPVLTIALGLLAMGIDPPQPKTFVQVVDTPRVAASSGMPQRIELKFRVSDGFHINSNLPRSSYLIPTKLELKVPPEVGTVKIAYPEGEDFTFAFAPDEKLNVYSDEFPVYVDLNLAKNAKMGHHTILGELSYQACNDRACFPPKKLPVTIEVEVSKPRVRSNLSKKQFVQTTPGLKPSK
jgi:hypothetical protein